MEPAGKKNHRWEELVLTLLFAGSVLWALFQSVFGALAQSATYDEHWHREWNRRLFEQGVTERDSVTHFKSTTPILLPNIALAKAVLRSVPAAFHLRLFLERLPGALWLAALALFTFMLGRQLGGRRTGLLAGAMAALDPNLISHSSLLTVDVPFAALSAACFYFLLRALERPSAKGAAAFGAAFGLALSAKFTALLFPAVFLILPFFYSFRPLLRFQSALRAAAFALISLVACLLVICAAYLFLNIGTPLAGMRFYHHFFLIAAKSAPELSLPLPEAFLTGVDQSLSAERARMWNVVLLDRFYSAGVWFYFFVVWLLKTPLPLLFAAGSGLLLLFGSGRFRLERGTRFLAAALAVFLAYFSFLFQTQVGLRYVFFCLPLLYVLAAKGFQSSAFSGIKAAAVLCGAAACMCGQFLYTGNMLAYTNLFVQPKELAYLYLADSNLDWGQNRDKLRAWLSREGLNSVIMDPAHILPGKVLFSTNQLAGVWWNHAQHRWVRRHLRPLRHIGYTYFLFEVSPKQFDAFLDAERRLKSEPARLGACSGELPLDELQTQTAVEPGSTVLCLAASNTASVRFFAQDGNFEVGPRSSGQSCPRQTISSGQEVWYRLEPGVHEFCVKSGRKFSIENKGGELRYAAF